MHNFPVVVFTIFMLLLLYYFVLKFVIVSLHSILEHITFCRNTLIVLLSDLTIHTHLSHPAEEEGSTLFPPLLSFSYGLLRENIHRQQLILCSCSFCFHTPIPAYLELQESNDVLNAKTHNNFILFLTKSLSCFSCKPLL